MHFAGIIIIGYIFFTTFGEYILGFIFLLILLSVWSLKSLSEQSSNKRYYKSTSNNISLKHKYAPNYIKREDIMPMHDDSNGWDDKINLFVKYPVDLHEEEHYYTTCKTFTVIDFETANAYSDSVCQIGIAKVVDNVITESFSLYVRPPYKTIRGSNFDIHSISWNELANAKYFDELWPILKPYIQDQHIATYNAKFDISCLEALFNCYGIKNISYAVFDILPVARSTWTGLPNYKLVTVSKHLNIPLTPHQAEADAIAAATIQIKANAQDSTVYMYCKRIKNSKNPFLFMRDWQLYDIATTSYNRMVNEGTDERSTIFSSLDVIIKNSNNPNYVAKACRLYGETLEFYGFIDEALSYYRVALSYNENVGVKRKIKTIENKLAIEKMKIIASQIKK